MRTFRARAARCNTLFRGIAALGIAGPGATLTGRAPVPGRPGRVDTPPVRFPCVVGGRGPVGIVFNVSPKTRSAATPASAKHWLGMPRLPNHATAQIMLPVRDLTQHVRAPKRQKKGARR